MSTRRASVVGDELIAEQGAERKRRQAAQLAEARKRRKPGGSGYGAAGKAKQGKQGSEQPADRARKAAEVRQGEPPVPGRAGRAAHLIRWFFRAMGEPDDRAAWMGQRGVAVEICNRMGTPTAMAAMTEMDFAKSWAIIPDACDADMLPDFTSAPGARR